MQPTVRIAPSERDRIQAAAERHGYAHYTEWMHDVVMAAVKQSELDHASQPAPVRRTGTRKRR